jgi:uncharacterized membrane protein (UPF0182 family)
MSQMPEAIKPHIRYPSTMLNIQANIYRLYHVNDVTVFFQGEDRWDIAREKVGAGEDEQTMQPNYYMIKMPGEADIEFVNSIPFTPRDRNNMISLLVARNDGEHYGEIVLYRLPKGRMIMGPSQIDAQISQHPQISQDFALWENSGSTYSRGNMFVIPIETSIMYVEPIYLRASVNSMPEVKRVIIYYNEKIAYEATLAEALESMFGAKLDEAGKPPINPPEIDQDPGGTTPPPEPAQPPEGTDGDEVSEGGYADMTVAELISAAQEAFDRGEEALKTGDWAAYGQAQADLQEILAHLAAAAPEE